MQGRFLEVPGLSRRYPGTSVRLVIVIAMAVIIIIVATAIIISVIVI